MGYRRSPFALEGAQGNLTAVVDPDIDMLPEGVDDDEEWDFDGTVGGDSKQRVGVKRNWQDFHDKCCRKKRKVWTNVAESVVLSQELLLLADASVNAVLSAAVPVFTGGDTTGLATELGKAKARIA